MANFEGERTIIARQIRNRLAEIEKSIYTMPHDIAIVESVTTGKNKGPERAPKQGWEPFDKNARWGGFDETRWFRMRVTIPKAMKGQCVVAKIRIAENSYIPQMTGLTEGGESLAYVNGEPFQGLDRNRDELFLTQKAKGDEKFEILLEACPSTRFNLYHMFGHAYLTVFNRLPWEFYWDALVALEVSEAIDQNAAARRRLLALILHCVQGVDLQTRDPKTYETSLRKAQRALRQGLKTFESETPGRGTLTLAGHSHIDTAWLWPLRETRRKCGRTFSTMLNLMDRYPEFYFSCSQPIQYVWVKEHYPELYNRIKKRVKEGRWELCGASWIEPDHNVPSGESLIRQYLYGNRFFQKEFGQRSNVAWVPDSFGYTWQLPQIMKMCQLEAFITTKIDWSQFTGFPYSMFLWEGADGTRLPAVMPPLNYNGNPVPKDCIAQWEQFKQKDKVEELPFPFGWGDGGGGPTMNMIEHGRRLKNVAGVPKCQFGRLQDSIMRMIDGCDTDRLPTYNDELYLELHRACQITQARTKRNNRKGELALRNAEFLGSMALLNGGAYDWENLWEAWQIIMTNQFHDILPGSSITEVYTQCDIDYARAFDHIAAARANHVSALVRKIDTSGEGDALVVFNTLSWVRSDVVQIKTKLPGGTFSVVDSDGVTVPYQKVGQDALLFEARDVSPLGYAVYHIVKGGDGSAYAGPLKASETQLENVYLRVKINKLGQLISVYDKLEEREVLPDGAVANELQFFDDRPYDHDAWDTDFNFDDTRLRDFAKVASLELVEQGPLRASIRVVHATEKSTLTQTITLCAGSPRLEFHTHAEWHEKRVLLKAAFPIDVRASHATYEMQFCAIERPTHKNRSDDRGRFEVTGHKWADLSEGNYGASVLNDSKYSYDTVGNVMRLSLLRAPIDPDPKADEGAQDFSYALYPHGGDWRNGSVQQGYELNVPLEVVPAKSAKGPLPKVDAFADIDAENVIIDTVKKAEDSKALIVRLYEAYGQRGDATITFGRAPKKVTECDGMEENDIPVKRKGNCVTLYITPHQIRTLKVIF